MGRVGQDAAFPRYRTKSGRGGGVVEVAGTPHHHDGSWIRLTHHGFLVDLRSVQALGSYFPLADLEEALTLTGRRLRLSYSNQASLPSPSRSRTSQKIHRLVTGCLRAT